MMMTPVPAGDPLMKAWEAVKATESYTNTKRWAAHAEHVDGSLWAMFEAGWRAAATSAPSSSATWQVEATSRKPPEESQPLATDGPARPAEPSSLGDRVANAQAEVAQWPEWKRDAARLQGPDPYTRSVESCSMCGGVAEHKLGCAWHGKVGQPADAEMPLTEMQMDMDVDDIKKAIGEAHPSIDDMERDLLCEKLDRIHRKAFWSKRALALAMETLTFAKRELDCHGLVGGSAWIAKRIVEIKKVSET